LQRFHAEGIGMRMRGNGATAGGRTPGFSD
jgi:hypothetical protein